MCIRDSYYYVTDAAQLENVIRKVQSISSINWNNYKITANDEVYQNISSALSDTGTLITTLIVVITAVSMVLIILILSMSIRSRKRETGILLAVGIAKPAVILQYVLETLLIAVVAFPLAYQMCIRDRTYTVQDGSVTGHYWKTKKDKGDTSELKSFSSTYVGSDSLAELMAEMCIRDRAQATVYQKHRTLQKPQGDV